MIILPQLNSQSYCQSLQLAQLFARQSDQLGRQPWSIFANDSAMLCQTPCVSVIVTLYNQKNLIFECLQSIGNTEGQKLPGQFEIIVIDDASDDGSGGMVEKFMEENPAIPVRLVTKWFHTGLSESRNLGINLTQAPYIFMMDTVNLIYPRCLPVLFETLVGSGQALAYSMIRKVDGDTGQSLGLLPQYEWDIEELLRRPYIDAMALIDHEKVLAVGGYSTDLVVNEIANWEEYDLWLKLADSNYTGKMVPQILGTVRYYRAYQFGKIVKPEIDKMVDYFGLKFHSLLKRYAGLDLYFSSPRGFYGYLQSYNAGYISGWAWDSNHKAIEVSVDIYLDGVLEAANVPANNFRQDLLANGMGDGCYSFSYKVPQSFQERILQEIRVTIAGTEIELEGSPLRV